MLEDEINWIGNFAERIKQVLQSFANGDDAEICLKRAFPETTFSKDELTDYGYTGPARRSQQCWGDVRFEFDVGVMGFLYMRGYYEGLLLAVYLTEDTSILIHERCNRPIGPNSHLAMQSLAARRGFYEHTPRRRWERIIRKCGRE